MKYDAVSATVAVKAKLAEGAYDDVTAILADET